MALQQRTDEGLRELALFAGAGGGMLGGKLLGWRTVCAVEVNDYCRRVLMQRQDDGILKPFPIWDDIRSFNGRPWRGVVDVVSGGFPCQRFSTAARGQNNAEDLWPEMLRVIGECGAPYVFAENVSRAAVEIAAEDLRAMGYKTKAIPLSASDLGADHERPRYWLRAHANLHSELRGPVDAKVELCSSLRPRVWETYPDESRVADGVANRMERLRATGNGQIPAVAATAWRTLTDT